MQFYAHSNGRQIGPLSIQDIEEALTVGLLTPGDLVWHEGMESWGLIKDVFDIEVIPEKNSDEST